METHSFKTMVHNATEWDYPLPLHAAICCELRINPATWVVPAVVSELWAAHYPDSDDMVDTDAFSDEAGNVVYFFTPDWTDRYRLWLVHHELFHQSQFYDNGNFRGGRWAELGTDQRYAAWEKEACAFADQRVGKPRKDFNPYSTQGETSGAPDLSPRTVLRRQRRTSRLRIPRH